MATTSYLYHTLGLKGYVHQRTDYRGGGVFHHVELAPHKRRCRNCSARWNRLQLQGCFQRCIRTLPVATRHQFVVLHGHRQSCSQCDQTLREPIAFAQGKRRYTNAFAQYVVQLCRIATIKAVARLLGVGWDLVKEIHKEHLGQRLKKRKLSQLRYLAIDEFATHSGHLYMTVVLDLESGQIVSLHEGKDAQALVACLRYLKGRCKSLRAIAIDMSDAYRKAIRQVFAGKVDVVHDPYHVVALANQAIDQTRRSMMRKLETGRKQLLKGTRFLLLRGLENLNERSLEHLMQLMEINEPLYQAYLLKEEIRHFWNLPDSAAGNAFLDAWIEQAYSIGNQFFARLARTLHRHRPGLLDYFKHRISTGPLEGLNNKIKVLKRRAYGFRDMDYFKLNLYFIHEDLAT